MESYKLIDYIYQLGISPIYMDVLGSFFISFFISYLSMPKIIRVSYMKQLVAEPINRSSHYNSIPTLGGIAIYFSLVVGTSIFASDLGVDYRFFSAALVILFFIGLMDDLLVVAPMKKIYAQILSALLVIMGSGIKIHSLSGFLGIYDMSYWGSVVFTVFVFVVIINSYNLIDGIDGLAGGVALVASFSFIYIYYRLYDYNLGILAIVLFASILAFLRYNLSKKYKIFMGDTGSMIVGFILSFMLVRFLYLTSSPSINLVSAPVLAFAIFIIPFFDTAMVFAIRIFNGKSPFSPDKNHIHHKIIELGCSHKKASIIIVITNILIIALAFKYRHMEINKLFFLLLGVATTLMVFLLILVRRKKMLNKI